MARYDRIGAGYAVHRRADPRIAAQIHAALGDARSVLNVGAGAGSYEPSDRDVLAIEPSIEMIRQRARDAAPTVRGRAEALPFADRAFDAVMGTLTIHHFADLARGLREMQRVAPQLVLLTYDPVGPEFWLMRDYFPEFRAADELRFPTMEALIDLLEGEVSVSVVPIPADVTDGFLGAFWKRPECYFDPSVRRGISSFQMTDPGVIDAGLARLAEDLDTFFERYPELASLDEIDLGYRLVVAG